LFPQEHVSEVLSSFSCKKDKDVEFFLKEKAIVQEKKHISRTYLIFTTGPDPELAAYFTLAVNSMNVTDLECSNELRKKMNISNDLAQSYLIGQVGKRDGSQKGLGKLAISSAIGVIKEANIKVGCRVIRADCKPSLIKYYAENGFILARRNRDGDLNQMIRIINTRAAAPSS
jgi:hypothetical protein